LFYIKELAIFDMNSKKPKQQDSYMQEQKPYKFFNLKFSSFIWPLIIGYSIVLIYFPEIFHSIKWIVFTALYSLSMGIPFQIADDYIVYRLDKTLPWLNYPGKRLIITSLYRIFIGITVLLLANFVLYIFIRQTSIQIYIKESYHAFLYAIISISIAIPVSSSITFFKSWKQSAINEEVLKRDKLAIEYEALKNQVNPHFFFNSLTALISLVRTDQEKAVEFIEQFSKIFRYRLDYHQNQVVDIFTEKKIIEAVAFLYQIRFKSELIVNIDLPDSTDKFIVPMALQMLIENAVKHNVASIEKPLKIDLWLNDDYIIVQNNLQPKRTNMVSNKIGLKNIQSQYKYLSKKEVIIEHSDNFFTVKIPILNSI